MAQVKQTKAAEVVANSRRLDKITTAALLTQLFTEFTALHGDRGGGDDAAIIGGVAYLGQQPVTVIATDKGVTPQERIDRHFGCPTPAGYRKALRLMKAAEKFHRPIIAFVNTPGAYPGERAEISGQGMAIAQNLYEISTLKTPLISVIFGEGGSGGALALACGDQVWMTTDSMYSILSPEGFATILWKDSHKADEAAEVMQLTPDALFSAGVIDGVIQETADDQQFSQQIKQVLQKQVKQLSRLSTTELLERRQAKFRQF